MGIPFAIFEATIAAFIFGSSTALASGTDATNPTHRVDCRKTTVCDVNGNCHVSEEQVFFESSGNTDRHGVGTLTLKTNTGSFTAANLTQAGPTMWEDKTTINFLVQSSMDTMVLTTRPKAEETATTSFLNCSDGAE